MANSVTPTTPTSSYIIETQNNKNCNNAITSDQVSPPPTLPFEILLIIFQFATGPNQPENRQTLLNIRSTSKACKTAAGLVLQTYWNKIKSIPSIQQSSDYATKIEKSEKPCESPGIPFEDQASDLWKFKNYSSALGISRALILPCDYERHLQLLDDSLIKVWSRIQKQIRFGVASVPQGAQEIRAWLNDPANVEALDRITLLDLSTLGLAVVPPEIGQLKKLLQLFLHNNQLATLPPEIGKLEKLQYLYLNSNRLTTLPPEIGKLENLILLSFNNNQLTNLPPEIGKLSQLYELHLDSTLFTVLPSTFNNLENLRWIFLDEARCLFILDKDLPHGDTVNTNCSNYVGFRFYECPPSLATFCRSIKLDVDSVTLQAQFSTLSSELQNALTKHKFGIRLLLSSPYSELNRTLVELLIAKCSAFTKEEQELLIHEKVWEVPAETEMAMLCVVC